MKNPKSNVRIERVPNRAGVIFFADHLRRERAADHVDPTRTPTNWQIIGSDRTENDLDAMISEREIRATAYRSRPCEAVDMLWSASPEFFRPDGERAGEFDPSRMAAFAGAVRSFCDRWLPGRVVSLRMDLDEGTPHAHGLILPWVERMTKTGKRICELSYRTIFQKGLGKKSFHVWQDRFADECAPLGIERGQRGSRAQHVRPLEWMADRDAQLEASAAEIDRLRREIARRDEEDAKRVRAERIRASMRAERDRAVEDAVAASMGRLSDRRTADRREKGGEREK